MAKKSTGEMPFLDHLEELRWRIIWALGALVIGFAIAFTLVVKLNLIRVLQAPIAPYLPGKLIYTSPADPFSITLSVALMGGVVFAAPVIIYHVWAFLSPALHRHEKRVVIPVIGGAVVLFAAGVALAWFWVLPMLLGFLMTFQSESLDAMISAPGYFGFVIGLALTFGAAFELPVLILALAALGLVTPKFLSRFRPYAFVLSFALGAFVTPGDLFLASLALTAPLYLLYELSILLTMLVFRKRRENTIGAEGSPVEGRA